MFKKLFRKESLFVILVVAFLLRLVLINQSLWLDEAIGALVVKSQNYLEILTQFPKADNHPPLYYLTLKSWTDIFGYSEFALRSLSVSFGVLTVYFVYKIALYFFPKNRRVGLMATVLIATSPLHIYYSQEARMYSMAAFLATASFYFFLKIIKNPKKTPDWFIFGIFYTALIFTDYVPVFFYPVFFLIPLLKKKPFSWWRKFMVVNLPVAVLGYLWIPIFKAQTLRGDLLLQTLPAWQSVAGGATLKQAGLFWTKTVLGRISFFNKAFYYSLLLAVSIPFAFVFLKGLFPVRDSKSRPILLWFFVPSILGFVASFYIPIFIYFRFLFVIPAFYLITTLGVSRIKGSKASALFAVLVFINFLGWGIYVGDENQQRENWKEATAFVEERAKEGEVAVFVYPEPFAPYRWYKEGKVEAVGVTESVSAEKEVVNKKVEEVLEDKSGLYYFNYLRDLTDPQDFVLDSIKKAGFEESGLYSFRGVGEITYFVRD